jgi:protein TilB
VETVPPQIFKEDGTVFQKNEANLKFQLEETPSTIQLHISISKFVDGSLINIDVQPSFVTVTVKVSRYFADIYRQRGKY